jgi:hypothetical protein
MTKKVYNSLIVLIGVVCVYVIIRHLFFFDNSRPVRTDVLQGILIGFGAAIITAQITAKIKTRKTNGWTSSLGSGDPRNGMLLRAAYVLAFPGPINTSAEAMYWTTSIDGNNHSLSGKRTYVMHFSAGKLPPNNAFWSLTMGDEKNRFVPNSMNRYSVSDRTDLVPNDDGSVTIYIQNIAPAGHESNWLPAPAGNFTLWLRVYMPGEEILKGAYIIPPVEEVK